jgi:hypothetical protein
MKKKVIMLSIAFVALMASVKIVYAAGAIPPYHKCHTVLQQCVDGYTCIQNAVWPKGWGLCLPSK